jgi:hypothetical protein
MMQDFYLKHNLKIILFEQNLNVKPKEYIINNIQNKLVCENLKLDNKYVIEGSMGDFIIWQSKNVELIGYCS